MLAFTTPDDGIVALSPASCDTGTTVFLWAIAAAFYTSVALLTYTPDKNEDECHFRAVLRAMMSPFFVCECRKGRSGKRYYRCSRRTRRRRRNEGTTEASSFARSHMPPPLPLRPRRRRKTSGGIQSSDAAKVTSASKQDQSEDPRQDPTQRVLLEPPMATTTQTGSPVQTPSAANSASVKPKKKKMKKRTPKQPCRPCKSTLIDLARMQDWECLAKRAARHKDEAHQRDSDRLLPLHWACSGGPPPSAIRALIEAYKGSAQMVDSEGSTALHFACHYGGSQEVVEVLLEFNPKAVTQSDVYGRTPLFHAVDKGASIDVIRLLLKADTRMAVRPCVPPALTPEDTRAGQKAPTPSTKKRSARVLNGRPPLTMAWSVVQSNHRSRTRKAGKQWEKAMLLLRAAYTGSPHEENEVKKFRMVHAVLALDHLLPPQVLTAAMEMHPEQINEVDEETGQLPLHIWASNKNATASRFSSVLGLLLEANPDGAGVPDGKGRFPLNLTLESGRVEADDVKVLFRAAPEVIWSSDPVTGLLPFMHATVAFSAPAVAVVERTPVSTTHTQPTKAVQRTLASLPPPPKKKAMQSLHAQHLWNGPAMAAFDTRTQSGKNEANTKIEAGLDKVLGQLTTVFLLLRWCPESVRVEG